MFSSTCWTITTEHYGDAFVDDTKFGVTAEYPEEHYDPTVEATMAQAQQVLCELTKLSLSIMKNFYTPQEGH